MSTLAPERSPEEALDGQEPCSPGCLLCTTSRTPMKAYRPHTLDGDCWCTYGANGEKFSARSVCWVYTTLGPAKLRRHRESRALRGPAPFFA